VRDFSGDGGGDSVGGWLLFAASIDASGQENDDKYSSEHKDVATGLEFPVEIALQARKMQPDDR